MWDEFSSWLNLHYHVLFILLIGGSVAWFLSNRYSHWVNRVKKTEEECKKIDAHLNPKLTTINTSLNTLNGSFNSLVVYLKTKDGNMDTRLFVSKSPIQLSELGNKILVETGGKDFVDKNLDDLITNMDLLGIKTALDSQTYAPIVISQASTKQSFNSIKDYTFKNPFYKVTLEDDKDFSIPLDMGTITNVIGIYLRDKYLEKHPNLKPEDIPTVIPDRK